jgi:hypothetical protein
MYINIPDSFDAEWQCEMLRNLLNKLNELDDGGHIVSDGFLSLWRSYAYEKYVQSKRTIPAHR